MGVNVATYTPQPGTIAARVLAHLRTLDAGAMQSSHVIAEVLNVDADIAPYMKAAFEHGLVAREKRDGRWWWGVGHSGLRVLAGPPAVTADDDAPIIQRTVKAEQGGVLLPDVQRWPGLNAADESVVITKPVRPRAKTAPPTPPACQDGTSGTSGAERTPIVAVPYAARRGPSKLRVALWSDGQLQIQRGDFELILLAPEETRELVKYLERIAEASE